MAVPVAVVPNLTTALKAPDLEEEEMEEEEVVVVVVLEPELVREAVVAAEAALKAPEMAAALAAPQGEGLPVHSRRSTGTPLL